MTEPVRHERQLRRDGSSPARGPNVVLVMCDQWRPDCLGVLGHPLVQTPNLDKLARGGVLFENAYCASPVCSPARASWLTGLYPHAHGQYVNYVGSPGTELEFAL